MYAFKFHLIMLVYVFDKISLVCCEFWLRVIFSCSYLYTPCGDTCTGSSWSCLSTNKENQLVSHNLHHVCLSSSLYVIYAL